MELIAFDPGDAWSGVSEILPKFQIFFPGQHAPRSLYIIRAFGTDSPLVQSPITWCLMFSYRKSKSKPRQNGWGGYGVWMKKKFKHQRNYTKRGLRDSWVWNKIIVGILNHWDLEYQDSNDCFTIIRSRCYNIIPEIDNKFGLDAIDVRGKNNTKMLAPRLGAIRTWRKSVTSSSRCDTVLYTTWYYYTWSYENRVSRHFVIFPNFPSIIARLLCCLIMPFFFFACFVVRDLCKSGCRQNYYLTPLPPNIFFPYPQFFV